MKTQSHVANIATEIITSEDGKNTYEIIKKIDTKVAMTINRKNLLQSNRLMKITSLYYFWFKQFNIYKITTHDYIIFISKCQGFIWWTATKSFSSEDACKSTKSFIA